MSSPTQDRHDTAAPSEEPAQRGGVGTKLLTDQQRAHLESKAVDGNPITMLWAQFMLRTDDNRRAAVVARQLGRRTTHAHGLTATGVSGPGGGRSSAVPLAIEYRGTTAQVAGLWPWSIGAGVPLLGTPLGRHEFTGEPVCFDPMNWFARGGYLTAPSLFVLGLNGFGKSSLIRRLILGGMAQGITPLILADVKPDYRDTIAACDGQVIDLGYGQGSINPLDPGVMGQALQRLYQEGLDDAAESLAAELRARQTNLVAALVELVRGHRLDDYEGGMISTALRILFQPADTGGRGYTGLRPPLLSDLAEVIAEGGEELMLDAVANTAEEYQHAALRLRRSLRTLTQGPFGRVFNDHTTVPLNLKSVGVVVDVSHIPKNDRVLKAAVMLTTWSAGFGAIEAQNVLTEVGLQPQRYFRVVLDELWQVLGLGEFMVDRVDEITRLQRSMGVEIDMISHSVRDLQGLPGDAADRAMGFFERSRAKIVGALPAAEIDKLASYLTFTAVEQRLIISWSAPQSLIGDVVRAVPAAASTSDGTTAEDGLVLAAAEKPLPPGIGKFLLKIGEDDSPGIPFQVVLTPSEKASGIHETSQKFANFGQEQEGRN